MEIIGDQATGDAFVRATLEAALADDDLRHQIGEGRSQLYRAFNSVWSSAYVDTRDVSGAPASNVATHEAAAQERLSHITPANRQALLLTTLENFSINETAYIMDRQPKSIGNRPLRF